MYLCFRRQFIIAIKLEQVDKNNKVPVYAVNFLTVISFIEKQQQ